MQIIEIKEPGACERIQETVVGIDFGTTNSLIAISENFNSKIIKMSDGRELVPSIIYILDNDVLSLNGKAADKSIRSIKRLLAKSSEEIKNNPNLLALADNLDLNEALPRLKLGSKYLSIPELAASIFKYLKQEAQKALGHDFSKAVVSVPAYFDDNAKGQVLLAARLAGLEVIRLIAEPTAAAYAYGLNKQESGAYLVYDLGGGTFDVSVLNMQTGIMQVIATGGDNMLGGDDIDMLLAGYICTKIKAENNQKIDNKIILLAKKAKEDLSTKDDVIINYKNIQTNISVQEFEQLILPIVKQTVRIAKDILYDANNIAINGIILVGGATRIPLIRQTLKEEFGTNIYSNFDPDKIVALGCAIQAENLSSKANSLLIDVVPLSVGIELYGSITQKIIARNTPIPYLVTEEFTTHCDNQTGMQFHILQGEREMAKDCRSLAHFELKDIPPDKAGRAKVAVTFAIDADGILSVTAREAITNKAHIMEIKPTYGLKEEQILDMLKSAYENAAVDHNEKLLTESRQRGEVLIAGIEKALADKPWLLADNEKIKIINAINSLQTVIILDNQEDILVKIDALNDSAADFIEKHLNEGVDLHLKGRHINSI